MWDQYWQLLSLTVKERVKSNTGHGLVGLIYESVCACVCAYVCQCYSCACVGVRVCMCVCTSMSWFCVRVCVRVYVNVMVVCVCVCRVVSCVCVCLCVKVIVLFVCVPKRCQRERKHWHSDVIWTAHPGTESRKRIFRETRRFVGLCWHVCVCVCLSVCLSDWLCVCLSACLSDWLCVCVCVCLWIYLSLPLCVCVCVRVRQHYKRGPVSRWLVTFDSDHTKRSQNALRQLAASDCCNLIQGLL